ncbi:enoyl-CoA hydratase [Schinkia azotoformans]|uniref:enoyl-CoA hydratase n=1 Tax=Schinkia azotoformans TaxID=1454 RepID=UPI002DBE0B3E|nr:enoyl-CoA hydratase [Schinkia azotoformans]MEC1722359.1 enoyl-CoA hydratase [Schinkia azotoformans]MED4414545.1 enoyl-CoA hydratase [Schinkia azotoformans]
MSQFVVLSVEGSIATLQLNRPECMNALNVDMLNELLEKLKEVASSDASILIISGNGNAFSAGGDIKALLKDTNEETFEKVMDTINEVIMTLYALPKLVISAINGPAAGLGFSFALAGDYVIAEKDAKIAMNFINIGLIPDGGGHFFLKQRLGDHKAMQVIWEGKIYYPYEAHRIGLIDEVSEIPAIDAAYSKANEWLQKPIEAMIKSKKIISDSSRHYLLEILRMEKIGQMRMRETVDHQEGINAFLEKRTPVFTGR